MAMDEFDWCALESAAVNQMIEAVRTIHDAHPQERLYGALFNGFYGDGEIIYWPGVAVGSEESLAQVADAYRRDGYGQSVEDLRWSPADLPHYVEPDDVYQGWAEACCEFASRDGTISAWEKVYDRYLHVFPQAAKKAFRQLRQENIVDESFVAIACDEAGDLIPLSLTKAQLSRHFPQYDAAEKERRYLSALPLEERIAELIAQVCGMTKPGLLYDEYEQMLRDIGAEATPALIAVLQTTRGSGACSACRLLAEINEPTSEAIIVLTNVLNDTAADEVVRSWAAAALARLGRMNVLVNYISQLPADIIVSGLAAPYLAFRNDGQFSLLDYRPLEEALGRYPHLADAVAAELAPGRSFCKITPDEAAAARSGLTSPWPFIRRHAEIVLERLEDKL
ncbi:DUF4303 domain-containing protein [Klebsiella aerogenes]